MIFSLYVASVPVAGKFVLTTPPNLDTLNDTKKVYGYNNSNLYFVSTNVRTYMHVRRGILQFHFEVWYGTVV